MPTVNLTDQQALELLKQLPAEQRAQLLEYLLADWPEWDELSVSAQEGARKAAKQRGRDWDSMSEEEKEDFVDELVHEDRDCSRQ